MPRNKEKYLEEYDLNTESVNCCQLDVHKALIRERQSRKYEASQVNLFGKRSCTDLFCLLVFFVALIGWAVVSVIVFINGGPQKILSPTDSSNRRCGFDRGVENKPNILFFDITKCLPPRKNFFVCNTRKICVAECPTSNFSFSYYLEKRESLNKLKEKLICIDDFNKYVEIRNYEDARRAINHGFCADWYMASKPIARRCLPQFVSNSLTPDTPTVVNLPEGGNVEIKGVTDRLIYSGMNAARREDGFIYQVGEDLLHTWLWIIIFMIAAMFVSFIYIAIMRWISKIVVWASILCLLGLLGFTSYYTWKKYVETKNKGGELKVSSKTLLTNLGPQLYLLKDDLLKHEYTWLGLFILSLTSLIIILIVLLFLRNRLKMAIQLIKEGSKAVTYAWSSLIFPVFPWILQVLIFAQSALIFFYLIGEQVPIYRVVGLNTSDCRCDNDYKEGDICNQDTFRSKCHNRYGNNCLTASCSFSENESGNFAIYLHLFNLLMLLWCEYFVSGFTQITLAMTFATYYWTRTKRKLPFCIVGTSVSRVFQYHLGTVAFGSFLLALLNWVRIMAELFYRYLNKKENSVIRCIKCCCGCFLACVHNILKILTKNAYIMCAMKGTSYCVSAKHAFSLITKNIIRAAVLDGVTSFLFFLVKLLITGSMGVLAYYFFSEPIPDFNNPNENYKFDYYFIPIFIICLSTFFITNLFFSVYATAVDTIFLSALEDLDQNDGSPEKPYFMSKSLIKIFKVRNGRPM